MQPQMTVPQMGGAQAQYAPPNMAPVPGPGPGGVYHQPGVQMSAPPASVPATSIYGSAPTHQRPLLQTSSATAPNIVPGGPVPMAMGMGVASAAGGVASAPGGVASAPGGVVPPQAASSTVASVPSTTTAAVVSGATAAAGGGGGVSATPSPGPEKKKKKKKVHHMYRILQHSWDHWNF